MDEKNVGTLAKFMGISPHTIKYYEKIGLLSSNRDEKSNYRRYEMRVCKELSECIRYRNMGFSLKDLHVLRKTVDEALFKEMVAQRIHVLEGEIQKAVDLRDYLKQFETECDMAEQCLNQWYVMPFHQVIYCRMQTDNMCFTEKNIAAGAVNIMDYVPMTNSVVILDKAYMEGGKQTFSWGQSLHMTKRLPEFEQTTDFLRLEPKKVFVTYKRYTEHFVTNGEMMQDIRQTFLQYSPVFPDHVYAFQIKVVFDHKGRDWNYFKVLVPLS